MGISCTRPELDNSFDELAGISFEAHIEEKNKYVPQIGHIKLLSYNIFIRPPMISNYGDDFKDQRIQEFVKSFYSYDIICLQEMFGSYSRRRGNLIEKAKEAGFFFHAVSPRPLTLSSHFIDGGLLVLSRYPIIISEFLPYPPGIGSDYYVNKGVLYTKIRIGISYLHLYTTHSQATYDGAPKYFLKRTEQFISFHNFIKETLQRYEYCEDDEVLLTGDFNVDSRSSYRFVSKEMSLIPLMQLM